jgi:hypothetical protein
VSTPSPLSQIYSSRRDMPFANTTTTAELHRNMMWLIYSYLTNQQTGGTLGPQARTAAMNWTVQESCDGSGAAPSASDLLGGGTYNSSKWVMNSSGSNHTWVRLRNATIGWELLLDLNSSTPGTFRFAAAPVATPFSGGTATAGPTSAAEFMLRNHSPGAGSSSANMADTATGGANYAHASSGADGSFFFLLSRAGSTFGFTTFISFQKTTDVDPAMTFNWVFIGSSSASGRGAMISGEYNTGANLDFRTPAGLYAGTGGLGPQNTFGGTAVAGNGTFGTDAFTGKRHLFPVSIIGVVSGAGVSLGRLADQYIITGIPTVGEPVTESGVVTRAVVGDSVIPMNGGACTV